VLNFVGLGHVWTADIGASSHNIQQGADMTQRIPENFSAAEWRLVTIMGNTMPPRDPNDDDDDDDEDNDTEPDEERRPPVVREPDEDD
jgi:hypothetical protein